MQHNIDSSKSKSVNRTQHAISTTLKIRTIQCGTDGDMMKPRLQIIIDKNYLGQALPIAKLNPNYIGYEVTTPVTVDNCMIDSTIERVSFFFNCSNQ